MHFMLQKMRKCNIYKNHARCITSTATPSLHVTYTQQGDKELTEGTAKSEKRSI